MLYEVITDRVEHVASLHHVAGGDALRGDLAGNVCGDGDHVRRDAGIRGGDIGGPVGHRITSYNVCYTKLLRNPRVRLGLAAAAALLVLLLLFRFMADRAAYVSTSDSYNFV